jgi:hypothetical protein
VYEQSSFRDRQPIKISKTYQYSHYTRSHSTKYPFCSFPKFCGNPSTYRWTTRFRFELDSCNHCHRLTCFTRIFTRACSTKPIFSGTTTQLFAAISASVFNTLRASSLKLSNPRQSDAYRIKHVFGLFLSWKHIYCRRYLRI